MSVLLKIPCSISGSISSLVANPGEMVTTGQELFNIELHESTSNISRLERSIELHKISIENTYGIFKDSKITSLKDSISVTKKYLEYLQDIEGPARAKHEAGVLEDELNYYQIVAETEDAKSNYRRAQRELDSFYKEAEYQEALDKSALEALVEELDIAKSRKKSNATILSSANGTFYPAVYEGQHIFSGLELYFLEVG